MLYRGTIAFDDDLHDWKGRDPVKRQKWCKAYYKTEKYREYKRDYMRKWRAQLSPIAAARWSGQECP
jgi:hypothetical protein